MARCPSSSRREASPAAAQSRPAASSPPSVMLAGASAKRIGMRDRQSRRKARWYKVGTRRRRVSSDEQKERPRFRGLSSRTVPEMPGADDLLASRRGVPSFSRVHGGFSHGAHSNPSFGHAPRPPIGSLISSHRFEWTRDRSAATACQAAIRNGRRYRPLRVPVVGRNPCADQLIMHYGADLTVPPTPDR